LSTCDVSTEVSGGRPQGASALKFELLAFRLHFQARDSIFFPPGKSGNIVRGAFGTIFRQLVCIPECHDRKACKERGDCPYARIFEPAAQFEGPSGLKDWPRPFVFRAAHLDGTKIAPGKSFYFDVHLFDLKDPAIVYFVLAFAEVVKQGIGPSRGRAALTRVDQLDANGKPAVAVYDGRTFLPAQLQPPIVLDLSPGGESASNVVVHFTTPTELKHGELLATRPEFSVLFGRIRDRLSTLRALYGPGPLEIDFTALGERAAAVKLASLKLEFSEAERKSARTGERHPLGGFVGKARYEGAIGEFLPYLRAGKWIGVGRQTVWGKGVIETEILG
jgi:hypothetical protein